MLWKVSKAVVTGALILLLAGCLQRYSAGEEAPRITREELRSMLGNADVVIIDVRIGEEWKESSEKIKGAVREDPEKDAKSWASKYPKDKTLIFYCS